MYISHMPDMQVVDIQTPVEIWEPTHVLDGMRYAVPEVPLGAK